MVAFPSGVTVALIKWPEVQELEQEEEGAEAKKARLKAKRNAKKNEKKHAKRKDVRPHRCLFWCYAHGTSARFWASVVMDACVPAAATPTRRNNCMCTTLHQGA